MKSKKLTVILSLITLVFLLTGCSTSNEIIDLSTPFKEVMNDGFFSALITYPIAQAINWLTPITGIFWSIAIITIVINIIIVAFTFKSSVAMQRMQEIQPEMNKIQAKYEGKNDDLSQQRMAMELQNLYKKYDINPFGTLITTFIQFPILIGMYNAVRRSSAVATATFFNTSLELTPKQAFSEKAWVCLIIYVLMILFQLLSIMVPTMIANYRGKKEAEKHHKTYKKPAQQNAVMTYGMIVMIGFLMLSWPTALSLYYLIYSLVNISKTVIVDLISHREKKNETV